MLLKSVLAEKDVNMDSFFF